MTRLRSLLLTGLLLSCATACIGCDADHMVLGENHATIDPGPARRELIQVDGRAVECWIARSPAAKTKEPAALVLYFTGKASRSEEWLAQVADSWGDKPVEVWGMNYPGSGGSEGPVSISRVGPDALAVYDAMRMRGTARPIFVQGGSFGTTVALCVAARRPVAGVILQNPPPLRELILGCYGWWNLGLLARPIAAQFPGDLDSLANAAHSTAPAVFILHGNDEIIPPTYHQRVVDAYAGPKQVIDMPGVFHAAPLTHEAAEKLAAWKESMWESLVAKPQQPSASAWAP